MWSLESGEDKYETHPIKLKKLLHRLDQLVVPFGNVESLQNVVPSFGDERELCVAKINYSSTYPSLPFNRNLERTRSCMDKSQGPN